MRIRFLAIIAILLFLTILNAEPALADIETESELFSFADTVPENEIIAYDIETAEQNEDIFSDMLQVFESVSVETTDVVSDAGELLQWLKNHEETGGMLTLDNNIILEDYSPDTVRISNPVVVDMGEYSIHMIDSVFFIYGDITFQGEGVNNPLFILEDSLLSANNGVAITAKGNDSGGGCAIRLIGNSDLDLSYSTVEAVGSDTVAIDSQVGLTLLHWRVFARGENAVAIKCGGELYGLNSVVVAEGSRAESIIAEPSTLTLDMCYTSPPCYGGNIIQRVLVKNTVDNLTEIPVGFPIKDLHIPDGVCYDLVNINDADDVYTVYILVDWDGVYIDTANAGQYLITGQADYTHGNFDFYPEVDIGDRTITPEFIVQVSEPYKPDITSRVSLFFSFWGEALLIDLPKYIDDVNAVLYCSEDLGKTWQNITLEHNVIISYNSIVIAQLKPDMYYGFKLVAGGNGLAQGESDILYVNISDGTLTVSDKPGGDRGVGSREPQPDNKNGNERGGNPNTINLSGSEVKAQTVVYPWSVPFIKDGIKVNVPSHYLLRLCMNDSDQFSVVILKKSSSQVSVAMSLNGKGIVKTAQPFTVYMPYKPDKNANVAGLVAVDSNGNIMPASFYDKATGAMILTIYKPGTYTISEKKPIIFSDTATHWAKDSIAFLSARGVVIGIGNGKFAPNSHVRNCEFIAMLAPLHGHFEENNQTNNAKWYTPFMNWASEGGIASKNISAEKTVTSKEAAVYLYKYAQLLGIQLGGAKSNTFTDDNSIGAADKEAIYALTAAGVLNGEFAPDKVLTRAESAEMITNFLNTIKN